jgi:hypothetical protein
MVSAIIFSRSRSKDWKVKQFKSLYWEEINGSEQEVRQSYLWLRQIYLISNELHYLEIINFRQKIYIIKQVSAEALTTGR